eukprot:7379361-Prymnesium_polylepis.1
MQSHSEEQVKLLTGHIEAAEARARAAEARAEEAEVSGARAQPAACLGSAAIRRNRVGARQLLTPRGARQARGEASLERAEALTSLLKSAEARTARLETRMCAAPEEGTQTAAEAARARGGRCPTGERGWRGAVLGGESPRLCACRRGRRQIGGGEARQPSEAERDPDQGEPAGARH